MNNIKIVRLQNGEDIICDLSSLDDMHYIALDPMSFQIFHKNDNHQIAMTHFLPVQLVKSNEIVLSEKDILFVTEPTDSFAEYYLGSIDKIKVLMKTRASLEEGTLDKDSMNKIIMDAFDNLEPSEITKH